MSRMGTQPLAENPFSGAYVPARVAIAEQRFDSVHAPEEKRHGHQEGEVRQRWQELHGELGTRIPFNLSCHPGICHRPHRFKCANPVVKRPEIHIIDAQGD